MTDVREVGYKLKVPCADCPFKKSTQLHSGVMGSLLEYEEHLKRGSFSHSCHKTDPRSDGYEDTYAGKVQHCIGLLSMLKSMEEKDGENEGEYPSLQAGLLYGIVSGLDYEEIPKAVEADVFGTFGDMKLRKELDEITIHFSRGAY